MLPAVNGVLSESPVQSSPSQPSPKDALRTTATIIAGALHSVQMRRVTVTFIDGLGFDRHSVKLHLLGPKSSKVFSTKWSSKLRHPIWKQQSEFVVFYGFCIVLCLR